VRFLRLRRDRDAIHEYGTVARLDPTKMDDDRPYRFRLVGHPFVVVRRSDGLLEFYTEAQKEGAK